MADPRPTPASVRDADPTPGLGVAGRLRRRLAGTYEVDEFGLDAELIELVDPLMALRWKVDCIGAHNIPREGPAVIVANRRFGLNEPVALGRAVRKSTGRRVRFLGIPDIAPIGPIMRKMGGAVNRPEELASLLEMGHVVSLPLQRSVVRRGHAGDLAAFALEPALRLGVPVIPAAVVGREIGRRWQVLVGARLPRLSGTGPLAMAELVDEARDAVQELLDEAAPPHWFFG